jgi:putative ABC transport system permease protein
VARADNLIVWFMQLSLPTGAQEGTLVYALEDFKAWNRPWSVGRTDAARSFTTTPIAFMDTALAQELSYQALRGKTTYVLAELAPGADLPAVRAEITRRLPYKIEAR